MSYIPEYHENYYRVEGTAYNQGKIGIGTINPVQLLHISGGNLRIDGTGYINGDLNITGNLNVYGDSTQFAVSQIIAEDKSIELNVTTGNPIGGNNYTTIALTNNSGANNGGIILKSTEVDSVRSVSDKYIIYQTGIPASGWVSNLRWILSGNYGKDTLSFVDPGNNSNIGLTISGNSVAGAVNLYRSGTDTLSTDDRFGITYNGGRATLHLNNTANDVGITIGNDAGGVTLYRSGNDTLSTDDRFGITYNGGRATLHLNNTANDVGITIGNDADAVALYRSGTNVLATDKNFSVSNGYIYRGVALITGGPINIRGNYPLAAKDINIITGSSNPAELLFIVLEMIL